MYVCKSAHPHVLGTLRTYIHTHAVGRPPRVGGVGPLHYLARPPEMPGRVTFASDRVCVSQRPLTYVRPRFVAGMRDQYTLVDTVRCL